jgi:hypothetical protein
MLRAISRFLRNVFVIFSGGSGWQREAAGTSQKAAMRSRKLVERVANHAVGELGFEPGRFRRRAGVGD